ncbi:hypothetical protein G6F46_010365 [Rhizopus delemar]|nr:hypothetical protein G6F55_009477 [Rhizopus delemar]KAG1537300.1 hypothetical protein G6F51_010452 [Rhizopus arrhizus]KAG1491561.1 hypothetical protein G6F54_009927 [Rhizopus delemar]KAG1505670.1 hypothetical protein G6F53_010134 [Rhizopus delemar]KAG1520865.1 hypothetical protein G6F52_007267 [Rhizopus delemar]
MMWTVFGSLALHLTWRKIDYREYKEKTQQKIQVMEEVAQCLEKGEGINESLRNEIKAVIRNELSLADEEEEEENNSILVKILRASTPEPTPDKQATSEDVTEGKWFEQKTPVYL